MELPNSRKVAMFVLVCVFVLLSTVVITDRMGWFNLAIKLDVGVFRNPAQKEQEISNDTLTKHTGLYSVTKPMAVAINENGFNNMTVTFRDIHNFNQLLTTRRSVLKKSVKSTNYAMTDKFIVAREHMDDYFYRVNTNKQITTYALFINSHFRTSDYGIKWLYGNKRQTHFSLPPEARYPFGLERGACDIFMKRGFWKTTVNLIGQGTCEARSKLPRTIVPITNHPDDVFGKEYQTTLKFWERIYMHVVPNARISLLGLVAQGNLIIEPLACAPDKRFHDPEKMTTALWLKSSKYVDEAFVSVHKIGGAYFHWNAEAISRIAIYLDFLRANTDIKIVIPSQNGPMTKRYLTILGIANDRLVWGKVTARIAYLPQGSRCGEKVSSIGLSMASKEYRDHIATKLQEKSNPDTIILIHRTKKRFLLQHEAIKQFLVQVAKKYKMRFVVFSDKNLPSFENTMRLFYRAALIVAPHGAGMVNAMFSRPGTVVIEIMCPIPNAVLCYPYLMRNLGHVYYGIRHDKFKNLKSCQRMWVDLNQLKAAVNFYMAGHVKHKHN